MSSTLRLAEELISKPSVTPLDAGCIELLSARLRAIGFVCERIDSGPPEFRVSNLWAKFKGFSPPAQTKLVQSADRKSVV